MRRIREKFQQARNSGAGGFVPFVTAGDPDLETSKRIVFALADSGADIIELGVPFSDPMADGPTIQASSQRALCNGVTVADVLAMAAEVRTRTEVPIILFSYLNPLLRYCLERLAADAAAAGVDGVLVTDAVDDDAAEISAVLRSKDLALISLVAPTTTEDRLRRIADRSTGFIYAVSRAGVTGVQNETNTAAGSLVARVRKVTDLPVAVGFGISTREQIDDVWKYADAAVVGSAIVAEIAKAHAAQNDPVDAVRTFAAQLVRR